MNLPRTFRLVFLTLFMIAPNHLIAQRGKAPAEIDSFKADIYRQFFVGKAGGAEFRCRWTGTNLSNQPMQVTLSLATPEFDLILENHLWVTTRGQASPIPAGTQPAFSTYPQWIGGKGL